MNKVILLVLSIFCVSQYFSQETFPVNGTYDKDLVYKVFQNAKIYIDHETFLDNADLIIANGKIVGVGQSLEFPENSVIYDMDGMSIYPSFIDLSSDYGIPKLERAMWKPAPQYETNKSGAFGWNQSIKPEIRSSELWSVDNKGAGELRKMGFGTVLTHQKDGISRGTATLVCLGSDESSSMLLSEAAAEYSLSKGVSRQKTPGSQMGAIALLRQTYYDASWYTTEFNTSEHNLSLESWNEIQDLPQIFNVSDKLQMFRVDKIAKEFDVNYIFRSAGDEYQRIEEIDSLNAVLIIPINFPKAYDVSDPYLERMVSLADMKHWELASYNPGILEDYEIDFCITSEGTNSKNFLKNLQKAIQNGLTEKQALKALTSNPAMYINADDRIGSLHQGKEANFIICSGNIFKSGSEIYENWVMGERHIVKRYDLIDLSGEYKLTFDDVSADLKVSGKNGKYKVAIEYTTVIEGEDGTKVPDTLNISSDLIQTERHISLKFTEMNSFNGTVRMTGLVFKNSKIWEGKGTYANGEWFDWIAVRSETEEVNQKEEDLDVKPDEEIIADITYPLMAFGWKDTPLEETILFKNITLWTCEDPEPIENGQLLIHNGKIVALGKDIDLELLFPKGNEIIREVDGKGKHLTPGIIDEHSHICVSGSVNEGSQASSAEVSIASVINSDDINLYRQLAGGVTAAQILHGSANPIGGQSGIIKFRWGHTPDEMLIKNNAPFIKFALGENVKQSNWGSSETVRFPQTRMGVEQVYYDHFIRAKEYDEKWTIYNTQVEELTPKQIRKEELPVPPRMDLELECLAEILNKERFVTCHSYRQDEINMLMHVADSMGFTLNTFTHILEGYKVADKMKAHGAGGSTFSDWWAYKFEVKDAIPYNAAVLYDMGIVVAINSDDPEMARRLNQEAAKAVKYGDVPEMEALKMVTLNPAILLHLDDRMGSLAVGKDADIVLWSDNPLSVYAKAEMTFVDGICYFSIEDDEKMREEVKAERNRLIQKMLNAGQKGEPMQAPHIKREKYLCCDSTDDGESNFILD